MSFISRILCGSISFKFNKNCIFTSKATQKLLPGKAHLMHSVYSKMEKDSFLKHEGNGLSTIKMYNSLPTKKILQKNKIKKQTFLASKLSKVDLSVIFENAKALPRGLLTSVFQKLCIVYHENKGRPSFHKEVDFFSNSETFKSFCQILEKELPKLTPSHIPCVLHLVYFNISPESDLMKKVFKLIMDNLYWFSVFELLEIYCELKEKHFINVEDCKNITNASEVYFETYFEEELSHYKNIGELPYFITERNLPLKIKELIIEKFFNTIDSGKYHLSILPFFFSITFSQPLLSHYKTQLLEKFKSVLFDHQVPKVSNTFSKIYERAIQMNDLFYDEEICKALNDNINTYYQEMVFIRVLHTLCVIGYWNPKSVAKVLDSVLSRDLSYFTPNIVLNIASIFARTSFHEICEVDWNKIKSHFESYNATKMFTTKSSLFQWCEYLTYLGCDTTELFRNIFNKANQNDFFETSEDCRSILHLYQYGKKYFPDRDLGIRKKLLSYCLQNATYKKNFYTLAQIQKFFGGDEYVLSNCTSSDFHFLPFVALLGPDNKPIDLSPYKLKEVDVYLLKNFRVITKIGNIEKPPGSKLIAFLEYPDYQPFQFRNAAVTSGYYRIFSKYYEGINCNIVMLPLKYFTLETHEKLKYLKTEIDKIIEKNETAE